MFFALFIFLWVWSSLAFLGKENLFLFNRTLIEKNTHITSEGGLCDDSKVIEEHWNMKCFKKLCRVWWLHKGTRQGRSIFCFNYFCFSFSSSVKGNQNRIFNPKLKNWNDIEENSQCKAICYIGIYRLYLFLYVTDMTLMVEKMPMRMANKWRRDVFGMNDLWFLSTVHT